MQSDEQSLQETILFETVPSTYCHDIFGAACLFKLALKRLSMESSAGDQETIGDGVGAGIQGKGQAKVQENERIKNCQADFSPRWPMVFASTVRKYSLNEEACAFNATLLW